MRAAQGGTSTSTGDRGLSTTLVRVLVWTARIGSEFSRQLDRQARRPHPAQRNAQHLVLFRFCIPRSYTHKDNEGETGRGSRGSASTSNRMSRWRLDGGREMRHTGDTHPFIEVIRDRNYP